jgi:hypothetical protein
MRNSTLGMMVAAVLAAGCAQLLGIEEITTDEPVSDARPPGDGAADARPPGDGAADARPPGDGATDAQSPQEDATDARPSGEDAPDASPPACTSGPCCSATGEFEDDTTVCSTTTEYRCQGDLCGGLRQQRVVQQFCSGTSATCSGAPQPGAWQTLSTCGAEQRCQTNGTSMPVCDTCQYGCDTNACRPGQLWVFPTQGQFLGNLGGRSGADAYCQVTYDNTLSALGCNRVHALLGVSAADRLTHMHVNYGILQGVPVRRAVDGLTIANNWLDLVNPNLQLLEKASTASELIFWSGLNTDRTCEGWTSGSGSISGDSGDGTVVASWLSRALRSCNLLYKLMCVCWYAP